MSAQQSTEIAVLDVECSQCRVLPGRDCIGPGEGFHLSRFDRLADVLSGDALPVYPPASTPEEGSHE